MRRSHLCTLALALALPVSAVAVTGGGPARFAPGERIARVEHPELQARLSDGAAWQRFLAERGYRWQVTWDEATGTPMYVYGEGWAVDPVALADDEGAWGIAWGILGAYPDLLAAGVPVEDLGEGTIDRRADITTVVFDRTFAGLPVEGDRINLRFKADRFVMAQGLSMPDIRLDPTPTVGPGAAYEQAIVALGWSPADVRAIEEPDLVVFPVLGEGFVEHSYHLAWRTEIRRDGPGLPSSKVVWIDAHTGDLVAWEEQIRFASGTVQAEIDDRYPQVGLTVEPMPYVDLGGDSAGPADGVGLFSTAGDPPQSYSFQAGSSFMDIDNEAGGDPTFTDSLDSDGGSVVATPPSGGNPQQRRERAMLDVHVNLHTVIERAVIINPGLGWANQQANVFVNINDNCNAWYDGNMNFLRQGSGCNNTGRVADVAYHEYGHGFHDWSIIPGVGQFEAALSEGLSDYIAATITNDNGMSPGFFTGTEQPLRDIGPDLSWPDDIDGDPHITGLIIAGALWDLRTALIDDLGYDAGVAQTDYIFGQVTARSVDIPSSYEEALLADDDNGNLSDGTPNQCAILDTFGLHGLGPGAGAAAFFVDHDPLVDVAPGSPIPVAVSAALSNPDCADGAVSSVQVRWSTSSDSVADFATIDLSHVGGDDYFGEIPAAADSSFLRYRIDLFDAGGAKIGEMPSGSITDPWLGAWVGDAEEIFFTDLEADDGDFAHELVAGPDQEGADDWGWGTASGAAGDPQAAASGSRLWGNDIVPASNWNGAYQPNIHNLLRSPVIQVPGDGPVYLQFRRWLTVEDGYWDDAWVSVNGTSVWTQLASTEQNGSDKHHLDNHWAFRSYEITDLVAADGTLQIEFHLQSDAGLEFGGWNVDDIAVVMEGEWIDPGDDDDDDATDDDDVADDDDTDPQQDDDDSAADDDDDDDRDRVVDPTGFVAVGGCSCTAGDSQVAPGLGLALLAGLGLRRRRR